MSMYLFNDGTILGWDDGYLLMNCNLDQYLVLGVSMVFTDGPALDDIPLGAELGTVDNDILGSGKDDER